MKNKIFLTIIFLLIIESIIEPEITGRVINGSIVNISYEGYYNNGSIFSKGTMSFRAGDGEVIPGIDKGVIGLRIGEEKELRLNASQAFGNWNKLLIMNISKDYFPNATINQELNTSYGPARIIGINNNSITIDLNHPLAGKNLTFRIKVLSVNTNT